MRIDVRHRTEYVFDGPVFLEPHVIRLRPRSDATVRLVDFGLDIDPAPVLRADNLDIDGNVVTRAWFEGTTTQLEVRSRATVDTFATDPFQFLVAEPERTLPYAYATDFGQRLAHYRQVPDAAHVSVREVALEVARGSKRDQSSFPLMLAQHLSGMFTMERRPEGEPQPPEVTIDSRRGACRDIAVLFIECCRAMGLAARFVSGYALAVGPDANELHAWAEVYLRGGGWRGYDPSQGLAVGDRHVPVAAAAEPRDAAAVTGTFRGDGVRARLDSEVVLQVGSAGAPSGPPPLPTNE